MRLENEPESKNVEDRREESSAGMRFPIPGGDRMRIPLPGSRPGGGISLITMLIIIGIALFFGKDLGSILGGGDTPIGQQRQIFPDAPRPTNPTRVDNDEMRTFVARVLGTTEGVWNEVFQRDNRRYVEPKLVLFRGSYPTACGQGEAAMGPFYCPLDQKIYIDLAFYEDLRTRFGAPGDFAQAYVVAHEVGHHVQTLLGITERVQAMKQRAGPREANAIQVRMELQADCLAGVWANVAQKRRQILDPGDVEEALRAAAAIGDDMIQRKTTGRVVPDAFTHGTSEQRVRWFRRGIETGDTRQCDTFSVAQP